jgi:RNA polymerase sigma-70 factor, ECF subfamily
MTYPVRDMSQSSSPAEILANCLDQGSESAWELFVQMFQPIIGSSIARVASRFSSPNPALIDDLTQETFLRLCRDNARVLRGFQARHDNAIFGYIKVIATSIALDHFRARSAQKRASEVPAHETQFEPQVRAISMEQETLLREIDRRLAATESERDRTIFWLYYRQGYSAREIAELPHLSLTQKGVESCIHRLTSLLRAETGFGSTPAKGLEGKRTRNTLGEMT